MKMFFKYRLKALAKEKPLVFWSLLFPLILVTFFNFTLTSINESSIFKPFPVAVVGSESGQLAGIMKQVEINGEKLFKLKFVDENEAKILLENGGAEAIVTIEEAGGGAETVTLGVNTDGSNQLLLKELLDNYSQKTAMITAAIKNDPNIVSSGILDKLDLTGDNIKHMPVSEKSNNTILISFYSAIAMTCLYGAFISAHSIETLQANQSAAGERLSVSPYGKLKMLAVDFAGSCLLILLCVLLTMAYMKYALGVEFSNQFGGIALVSVCGSLVSTAFGYFISLLLKRKTNAKISIIVSITMLWSALAGMMAPPLKYLVEKHVPYINWINPVALLTDSYTSIYYYGNLDKAYSNLAILLVLFVLLMGFSVMKLRRQQYESL
ncbi:MAG: ABC transporter permease [Clostridiales Family XIII bacterium]|jgi:ABC-2 type transport system permease protein|nr:ABC transporter permease [Clostridiales Family XIII bacterium]